MKLNKTKFLIQKQIPVNAKMVTILIEIFAINVTQIVNHVQVVEVIIARVVLKISINKIPMENVNAKMDII